MYVFRGNEPRPFAVKHPFDLYEQHRTLICEHLQDDLPLLTVYCPIWKGENGVWGHINPKASSAVCLTNRHWLISFDFHNRRMPEVIRVAHKDVLSVEVGKALLQGWFRLNYLNQENAFGRIDILFNTHVFRHFRQLLGLWRFFSRNQSLPKTIDGFFKDGPHNFLLLPNETIVFQLNLPAVKQKKGRKIFIKAHETQILLTSENFLLFAIREASSKPQQLTFAEAFHSWDTGHSKARFAVKFFNEGIDLLMTFEDENVLRHRIFKEQISLKDLNDLSAVLNASKGAQHAIVNSESS